jgi:hypothetical protein
MDECVTKRRVKVKRCWTDVHETDVPAIHKRRRIETAVEQSNNRHRELTAGLAPTTAGSEAIHPCMAL